MSRKTGAEATAGSAFATAAGLIAYALQQEPMAAVQAKLSEDEPTGWFGRLGYWLRETF